MNIINILNTQGIQRSAELPYRGDTPILNPGTLLDILVTELPSLFKDILKGLGFDVSNWPDSFHISEKSEDPLLTIIYPSLTGNGRTIDDILAHTKGPVLILDPNPIYSPSLGHGRKIVSISMADFAIEIIRRIGGYSVSPEVRKRIEELCKVWILIGMMYQGTDLNKPFGEQPRVRYNIPARIKSTLTDIEQTEIYRRIRSLLGERLKSEISNGMLSFSESRVLHHTKSAIASYPFPYVIGFSRHNGINLVVRSTGMTFRYAIIYHREDISFISEIYTDNKTLYITLKKTLQGWRERSYGRYSEHEFYNRQDVTRKTIQDVVDEVVTDICDVVTGKKVY